MQEMGNLYYLIGIRDWCMAITVDSERGEVNHPAKLRTVGGSVVLTIPPDVLIHAGLATGDTVALDYEVDLGVRLIPPEALPPDLRDGLVERDLRSSGNSTVVTIPPVALDATGWQADTNLTLAAPLEGEWLDLRQREDGEERTR
jgi:antitoxin component of MazEF toxin-antitoxin module